MLYIDFDFIFTLEEEYSRTSTNSHLTTKAIFFLWTVNTLTLVSTSTIVSTFFCP